MTRSCIGIWDLLTGTLKLKLADAPLGAIITHAVVTSCGKYILSVESGCVIYWDLETQKVIYKDLPVNDPKQRRPDISKAREILGWEPKVSRAEGLKITFEYFKSLSEEELFAKEHNTFEEYIR